jgi:4-hydroxyphenylacetate 3-monooxygenase
MRTGREYLESLRDARRVYVGGELIEDVTVHPATKGYAHAIADYYDLHLDPANQDAATFIDKDGKRQSMHWFLPQSKEDLTRRRKYTDFLCRHFNGKTADRSRTHRLGRVLWAPTPAVAGIS